VKRDFVRLPPLGRPAPRGEGCRCRLASGLGRNRKKLVFLSLSSSDWPPSGRAGIDNESDQVQ